MSWYKKSQNQGIPLVSLITDEGSLIKERGYAIEGLGILDASQNEYPAGLSSDGTLYAAIADENGNVLSLDGSRALDGWNMAKNYKELLNGLV